MACSTSITWHLLRGLLAFALLALAFSIATSSSWLAGGAALGAFLLLRGCPMCWLMGLIQRIAHSASAARTDLP